MRLPTGLRCHRASAAMEPSPVRLLPVLLPVLLSVATLSPADQPSEGADAIALLEAANLQPAAYSDLLLQTADSLPDADRANSLLLRYLPRVKQPQLRQKIYRYLAELAELAFRLSDAQRYYHEAYSASLAAVPVDYDSLYCSAALLAELGRYDESQIQSLAIMEGSQEPRWRQMALLVLGRIYAAQGDTERAVRMIETMNSDDESDLAPLLSLYEIAIQTGDTRRAEQALASLETNFPDSAAHYIVEQDDEWKQRISAMPTPFRILGGVPAIDANVADAPIDDAQAVQAITADRVSSSEGRGLIGIQIGSFGLQKNGDAMRQTIEQLGFSAMIRTMELNGATLYRVIIPVDDRETADRIIIALRQQEIEGFPLFE